MRSSKTASRIVDGSEWKGINSDQHKAIARVENRMWLDAYVSLNALRARAWQENDDATYNEIDNLMIELYLTMRRKEVI